MQVHCRILIDCHNFTISNSGGTQYDLSDFASINIGNSGSDTASLNGAAPASNTHRPSSGQCPAPAGVPRRGLPRRKYFYSPQVALTTPNPVVPIPGIHFARGDMDLTGAIISGTPAGTPANSSQVSEIELNQTGDGNGSTTAGTGTQFMFQLASADSMTFNAIASGLTQAALAADAISGTFYFGVLFFYKH